MATTTNYGWTTPDDTALVKDGAAAIRSLGSAIDTTTKNLNPGTTNGDIDYYATGTTKSRVAIGSSGQCLTVVAGVPSWAASPTSVLTTTGDLLYASAANTLARRGIGSTGDVLTVSGGVPTWAAPAAGAYTLISTTTMANATVTLSSIPQTYTDIFCVIHSMTNNTSDQDFRCIPNNSASITASAGTDATGTVFAQTSTRWNLTNGTAVLRTGGSNMWQLYIRNYASTTFFKATSWTGVWLNSSSVRQVINGGGSIHSTSAITSLVFDVGGTNTFSGGTILLYGVK